MTKCRRWFCVRIIFLAFLILVTIFKLTTRNYYAFDVVIDVFKIYSIYELFLAKSFLDLQQIDAPILMKGREQQSGTISVTTSPA